jgi:hypothetical protein
MSRRPDSDVMSEEELQASKDFYRKVGETCSGVADGEPENSGKSVNHFLERARAFARSGRVLILGARPKDGAAR